MISVMKTMRTMEVRNSDNKKITLNSNRRLCGSRSVEHPQWLDGIFLYRNWDCHFPLLGIGLCDSVGLKRLTVIRSKCL